MKKILAIILFVAITVSSFAQTTITSYEYWFDNDYLSKKATNVTPVADLQLTSSISTHSLAVGLHTFQIRFKDNSGAWSSTTNQFFVKLAQTVNNSQTQVVKYEYWFDNDNVNKTTQSVTSTTELSLVKSISVSELPVGLHTFQIRFQDNSGAWSSTTNQFFVKLAESQSAIDNKIKAYRYWFNEDFPESVSNKLAKGTNPYNLILNTNTDSLSIGTHSFNIQFQDSLKVWSSVVVHSFELPDYRFPKVVSYKIASNNQYIDVTFDEPIFSTSLMMGAVNKTDFTLTLNKNGGELLGIQIASLTSKTGSQLIGGETEIRFNLIAEGTPSGYETIELSANAKSVFDVYGNNSQQIYNYGTWRLKSSLIAWFPINGNANDESGNKINGIVNGAVLTTDKNNTPNSAYYFDGNSYIRLNDTIGNFKTSDYTISCWFKTTGAISGSHDFIGKRSAATFGNFWEFMQHDGVASALVNQTTQADMRLVDGTSNIEDNDWHMATISRNGLTTNVYIDGKLETSQNTGIVHNLNNPAVTLIGGRYSGTNLKMLYKGYLDELRMYNRCLSSAEIKKLFLDAKEIRVSYSYTINSKEVKFKNTSLGEELQFTWDFGDGLVSMDSSVVHNFGKTGYFNVCLTAMDKNAKVKTYCKEIAVGNLVQKPEPGFSYNKQSSYTFAFTDTTKSNIVSRFWEFGDGSASFSAAPSHTYQKAGNMQVCLTVSDANEAIAKTCTTIEVGTVKKPPIADFTSFLTETTLLFFSDTSQYNNKHLWEFGDGFTSNAMNPSHEYSKNETFTVCHTVFDVENQTSKVCKQVNNFDDEPVFADFDYLITGRNVRFVNKSKGNHLNWFWDFKDGATSKLAIVEHQFAKDGTYNVCLTVKDSISKQTHQSCKDLICSQSSSTADNVVANFDYMIEGKTVNFKNRSTGQNLLYFWEFGDGNIGALPELSHSYKEAGFYTVTLTVFNKLNGKGHSYKKLLSIDGSEAIGNNCSANFTCFPDYKTNELVFMNQSIGSYTNAFWEFGHSNISGETPNYSNELDSVRHAFPQTGYYAVNLTVKDDNNLCFDTKKQIVVAVNLNTSGIRLIADYKWIYDADYAGTFMNESFGTPTNALWTFGDGKDSSVIFGTPQYYEMPKKYIEPGFYKTSLEIWKATKGVLPTGNKKTVFIYIPTRMKGGLDDISYGLFGFPDFNYYLEDKELILNDKSVGTCTKWKWDFGDGIEEIKPIGGRIFHTYNEIGYYNVCLTITDGNGQELKACQDVRVGNAQGDISLSVKDIPLFGDEIKVYPNPSEDKLYIELPTNENYIISVFDILGKEHMRVQSENLNVQELEISSLKNGIYILKITKKDEIKNIRFLKLN